MVDLGVKNPPDLSLEGFCIGYMSLVHAFFSASRAPLWKKATLQHDNACGRLTSFRTFYGFSRDHPLLHGFSR